MQPASNSVCSAAPMRRQRDEHDAIDRLSLGVLCGFTKAQPSGERRAAGLTLAALKMSASGQECGPKLNISIRSPIAGELVGTYGLSAALVGFCRLSRLRPVNGVRPQLRSTNFRIETWS
jgi:hypothetical protein